jgi:DNA-binding transcriptional MerR regulator
MIRLLWIRKMADAGIALDDIRDAFADTAPTAADSDHVVAGILERLERTLGAQEAELQRQRVAVQRTRTGGSRMGLLSDLVASRLTCLPEAPCARRTWTTCWSLSGSSGRSARRSTPPFTSSWPPT